MNAAGLLAHYERIADAPDAINRLRRFVLELAVRGKLVAQDAAEELVPSVALRPPNGDAERTAKGAASKKWAGDSGDAAMPFAVPRQWSFVRLGEVLKMVNGRAFKPTDWVSEGLPIVRIQNLNRPDAPHNFCDPNSVDPRHIIQDGEFLISWSGTPGTSFGAFIWDRGTAALNQHIFRCVQVSEKYSKAFLRLAINSQLDVLIGQAQGGVGLQHVTKGTLESLVLPLPPLFEQQRIVAKFDELMVLCGRLDAARSQREALRDRLAAGSLSLLDSAHPETFHDDARFALDALPALTTRPDQIRQLRQTILSLAVGGKLVPQAKYEQGARISSGSSSPNAAGRLGISIPKNWVWARVTDVASARLGKMLDKAKNKGSGYLYLRNTNVHWFEVRIDDLKSIQLEPGELEEYRLRPGDVLICEGGHGIGRTAVWRGQLSDIVFQKALHRVRPGPHLDSDFFAYCCSVYFHAGVMQSSFTGVGIPHFTGKALSSLVIPIPPLSEQKRIVAKVNELMALCDQLEVKLRVGDSTRSRLLDALLHKALESSSEPNRARSRAAVSGYVVSCLASRRNFGRTAHMKYLYLAEARLGLDLGGNYTREAAGPLDAGIYGLEEQAKASDWYTHSSEILSSGNEKVSYQPGKSLKVIADEGINVLGKSRDEMDRLIDLMGGLKTEQVEIIATVFAAWNDALLDGNNPDDGWIVREVREHWHIRKQRFTPVELLKWLGWMRQNDIVPLGHPPRTIQQAKMEL